MRILTSLLRFVLLFSLLSLVLMGVPRAADDASSGFGEVVIPSPQKPISADQCVEPVDVMRRDHMKFLDHQRDATVIGGERDGKYSLVGCMNCHNPGSASGEVIRYPDPQHFCTECHAYASVKIDCFECHADRGLEKRQQSRLAPATPAWDSNGSSLSASTLTRRLESSQ